MKIGIKTYTTKDGYDHVSRMIDYADFIEILPIPDNDFYKTFIDFDTEFRIHTPHSNFGADPGDKNAFERTLDCTRVAIEAADFFSSKTIVVHPGLNSYPDSEKNSIEFLKHFNEKRFLIENLPIKRPDGGFNLGGRADDIKKFMEELNCGICFDFGHAFFSAFAEKLDYKNVIDEFMKLKPKYFHICGGSTREIKEHKDIFTGDFDIEFFKKSMPKEAFVVLETPHNARIQIKEISFLKSV